MKLIFAVTLLTFAIHFNLFSQSVNWSVLGNATTSVSKNFIGTTDKTGLLFKVNNVQAGFIDLTNNNTSFGQNTLLKNVSGAGNVAFGVNALSANITGYENVAIGTNSLYRNIEGFKNVSIGTHCLFNNVNGSANVSMGYQSLYSNVSGVQNVAIGVESMINNISGGNNVAVGEIALSRNTSGHANTAVGGVSSAFSTTGSNNSSLGYHSLFNNITGQNNVSIGAYSLDDQLANDNNTVIGYNSGRGITTGSGNTILGSNVTGLPAAITNNIIISDGLGNQRINVDATGKVGINKMLPIEALDVSGNIYTNGKILIGTNGKNSGTHSLAVNGSALFTKVVVKVTGEWPDYIFDETFNPMPLKELENFINKNKHLPNVPAAKQVIRDGVDIGETVSTLLKKVEELTLYVIAQNKKLEGQSAELKHLKIQLSLVNP